MASNIEYKNNEYSFVENSRSKELAWHQLGQKFDGEMDIQTALKLSHANYEVKTKEVFYQKNNGEYIIDKNYKYTYRTDTDENLGLVSKDYGIVQNTEAFEFLNNLCCGGADMPFIETAGVLGKGERIFVTAKFPEQYQIGEIFDDKAETYAVFTTSHNGTGAVRCLITPVRVVCNNTLNYAFINNKTQISFRHTSGVSNRIKNNIEYASQVLNCYQATKKAIEEQNQRLKMIQINAKLIELCCAKLAFSDNKNYEIYKNEGIKSNNLSTRSKNQYIGLMNSIENGIGQNEIKTKNAFWLMSGITSYYQNYANYNEEGKFSAEKKFDSLYNNGLADKKIKMAYELITK